MTELKNSFQQREAKLNKQIETTRAEADRELCDLRRQLNKVQDSHVELMEQVEMKHAEELSKTINHFFLFELEFIFIIFKIAQLKITLFNIAVRLPSSQKWQLRN